VQEHRKSSQKYPKIMSSDDVIFQHACLHGEDNGTLSLTSRGLTWRRSDGASSITILWTGIVPKSDKYQPLKGMIRIQDVHSKQFKIFKLVGEDAHKVLRKFELGKSFIKHRLYQEPCPIAPNKSTVSKTSFQNKMNLTSDERRKEILLDNDPDLKNWYNELIHQGICDTETFWHSRSDQLRDLEIEENSNIQGMVSSLLSDIDHGEFDSKGIKHIQMNHDSKNEIFLLYPNIKKEFLQKVPVQMTEDEFWGKYFQQQHAIYSNLHNSSSSIPNMSDFAKQQQQKRRGVKAVTSAVFVSPFVSIDVDLTTSLGDYHTAEILDPEDYKWQASEFINDKYVNKSTLVIQQQEERQQEQDKHPSGNVSNKTSNGNSRAVGYYRVPSRKRVYPSPELEDDSCLLNHSSDEAVLIPLQLASCSSSMMHSSAASGEGVSKQHIAKSATAPRESLAGEEIKERISRGAAGVVMHDSIFPSKDRALRLLHGGVDGGSEAVTVLPNNKRARESVNITSAAAKSKNVLDIPGDFEEVRTDFHKIYYYYVINYSFRCTMITVM
jgi:hypothetical protein